MAAVSEENPKSTECEEVLGGPVFEPRLYVQRYYYVQQQLAKFCVKHVVDFGSAECKISRFLVQIPTLEKLALVDLDNDLLEHNKYAIRPLNCDYLEKRDLKLHVQMYCGSVTELDEHVTGCDAVSMVEIIEHLQPDVLCAAVDMVFGKLQPYVVVITTPNADFNQLFPNFTGFRHWDHKFEWSRQEFQNWCDNISKEHPYIVEYGGIGEPPPGLESLGHCSQAAVFVRKSDCLKEDCLNSVTSNYKLIAESFYPWKERKESEEEMLLLEVNYQLRQYSRSIESLTGSCGVCAFNRSVPEDVVFVGNQDKHDNNADYSNLNRDSVSVESQSELISSYQLRKPYSDSSGNQSEIFNLKSDNSGNQSEIFNQKSDNSGNQSEIFNLKSDNSGNQFGKFNHEFHNTGNQCRNCNEESDYIGTSSTRSSISKVTECQNCGKTEGKLDAKECYVPVSNLMTRKVENVLQPDQLRKFLQSHGYRLSADCNHVIVTVEENQSTFSDTDSDDDDNIETYQSRSELVQTSNSDLPSNTQFNLVEALQCESWD